MRILFICNEFPPIHHGGIGSFTRLIAENLVQRKHEVLVVGNGNNDASSNETLNGVKVVRFRMNAKDHGTILNYFNMVTDRIIFYQKSMKYIQQFKPDLIETYDWSAPLICKPPKCKLITRLHGSNTAFNLYIGSKRTPLLYWLEKKAIRQSDHIVSVSDHIAEITQKAFKIKFESTTIYNGVDTVKFDNLLKDRDRNKILLVGRMHVNKGFDELFKAMNFIFHSNPKVHFQIICTVIEPYRDKLMTYVDDKYKDRVIFTGRVPNEELPAYYNNANLSVLPSRAEAFPIIPLESMACGTPVIMADRFSSREIIDEGIDGYIVNTTDPANFAQSILKILSDQSKTEAMRPKTREKIVAKFSIEKTINDNIHFYESCLKIR